MDHFSTRSLLAIMVAALVSPGALATWNSYGTHEPDNALDTAAFMWQEPPAPGQMRVYFNTYTGTSPGLTATLISPNVALLHTNNEAYALEYHMAILGVWLDCNGDGYIGLAETAAQEYPAAILLDNSVCPPVTGDVNVWTAGAHNYNGWVSEYVPIGGATTDPQDDLNDSRIYRDPEAMVWGDNGRPDDAADAGGSCALAPQPRGTYQSTGGFVNWVDCSSGLMERFNDVFLGRRLAGVDIPGLYSLGVPDTGLTFDDPNDARGTWIDHATFGTEDSSHSAVVLADCSEDNIVRVGDVINGTAPPEAAPVVALIGNDVHNAHVPALDPQTGDLAEPTAPATLNETQEDFLQNCDTSDDSGHDFYGVHGAYVGETDFNSVSIANKQSASWNLGFTDISRDPTIANLPANQGPTPPAPIFGGRAGIALLAPQASSWNSPSVLVKRGPSTVRADVNEGTATIAPAPYFTFYAHVGAATRDRTFALPGGLGEYAAAQCGENEEGIHNGWNCDGGTWYKNPDGTPVPEPRPFARPGQAYELRDIDCYDGANDAGVPLGVPAYGDDPCA